MGVLLDAVALEDWRSVIAGAVKAAKDGDAQARHWLAQYLMGRPDSKAPSPLNVVVQQLNGTNSLLDKLTHDAYWNEVHPRDDADYKAYLQKRINQELTLKIKPDATGESVEHVLIAVEPDGQTT